MTGKQKELRVRETYFKQVAREILLREGYQGLTINRVAEVTGFSRGTVYQFFGSKEELITALGIECRVRLLETVQKAARLPGRPRERMVAMGEMMAYYAKHDANDHRILKMIDSEAILDKVPESQQEQMKQHDTQIFNTLLGIVKDAIAVGDLVLQGGSTPQSLTFAFWAMVDGCLVAIMGSAPLKEAKIHDPMGEIVRNGHYLMDGYGWRPLSTECDYVKTARRVRALLAGEPVEERKWAVAGERR
ncbi:MAG TPA: TetR/AcrR family transcriptional regulator [Candidatus Bathyarchaeia archaeon]|nr:TetR/AcrR family transcriptional regulator [Candidatus Bathyarchaeia archaeon]